LGEKSSEEGCQKSSKNPESQEEERPHERRLWKAVDDRSEFKLWVSKYAALPTMGVSYEDCEGGVSVLTPVELPVSTSYIVLGKGQE
jgi:hypothetical protein